MVRGPHVGRLEEYLGVAPRPVGGDRVLVLGVGLDVRNDLLEGAVLADQVVGGRGANLGDGVEVVTAKEDAKVDELFPLDKLSN